MSHTVLLILFVLLALGVSFLCSILEAVLLSITPSYIGALERDGSKAGERLRKLKDNIDRPLASILSLNTIAHTVGATGAGAQAAEIFENHFVTAFSVILTLLILVFSEIIPKTLGASYWRKLGPAVSYILPPMILSMYPLVLLSQLITRAMGKGGHGDGTTLSREEFNALADIGTREGIFEEKESKILRNLFRFSSLRGRDIMTPRTVIRAYPADTTVSEVIRDEKSLRFSRLPIYDNSKDNILGYVLKDDVLLKIARDEHDVELRELRRELPVMLESTDLQELFELMVEEQEHMVLLVDEYGGTRGVVTMEDVVETLLGLEIVDEADATVDMQALARQQWARRAERLGIVPDGNIEESGLDGAAAAALARAREADRNREAAAAEEGEEMPPDHSGGEAGSSEDGDEHLPDASVPPASE